MTPDALVSELRDVFRIDRGETLHPRHPKYLGNLAVDAIARLTRERDEARMELAAAVSGLEMIAGKRPCIDNLMGNVDIALATLAALKTEA